MQKLYLSKTRSGTVNIQGKTFRTFTFDKIAISQNEYLYYKEYILKNPKSTITSKDNFITHFKGELIYYTICFVCLLILQLDINVEGLKVICYILIGFGVILSIYLIADVSDYIGHLNNKYLFYTNLKKDISISNNYEEFITLQKKHSPYLYREINDN